MKHLIAENIIKTNESYFSDWFCWILAGSVGPRFAWLSLKYLFPGPSEKYSSLLVFWS